MYVPYSRKVWWEESLANLANHLRFAKLKPSKLIVAIDNPLADLFIHQTFFCQMLENSRFAKHSALQTFPLYGMQLTDIVHITGHRIGWCRIYGQRVFNRLMQLINILREIYYHRLAYFQSLTLISVHYLQYTSIIVSMIEELLAIVTGITSWVHRMVNTYTLVLAHMGKCCVCKSFSLISRLCLMVSCFVVYCWHLSTTGYNQQ